MTTGTVPEDGTVDPYPFVSSILNLPKWFFNVIGSLFVTQEDDVHEEPSHEPLPAEAIIEEPSLVVAEDESFVGSIVTTLFTHFPAKLIIGPIDQDMSVISVVLLSTFVACLTSLLIIYLHSIFISTKRFQTFLTSSVDLSKQSPKSQTGHNFAQKVSSSHGSETVAKSGSAEVDEQENGGDECSNNNNSDSVTDLILHQFPRGRFVPCGEMEGMKIETLLRLTRIPHEVKFDCDNTGPWIEQENKLIWGSQSIILFLASKYPRHVGRFLVPDDCAIQAHFLTLHVENEVCWLIYHWRWFYGIKNKEESFAWSRIPPEYVELAASSWNRKFGDVSIESISDYIENAFRILSQVLGSNRWFVNDQLSLVDVVVFATLAQALWGMPTSTVEGLVRGKRNLVDFCERIQRLSWVDWEDHLSFSLEKGESAAGGDETKSFNVCYEPMMEEEEVSNSFLASSRTRTRPLSRSKIPFFLPPEINTKIPRGNPTCSHAAEDSVTFLAGKERTMGDLTDVVRGTSVVRDHGDWDGNVSESSCSTQSDNNVSCSSTLKQAFFCKNEKQLGKTLI